MTSTIILATRRKTVSVIWLSRVTTSMKLVRSLKAKEFGKRAIYDNWDYVFSVQIGNNTLCMF